MTTVAHFDIQYHQFLNAQGTPVQALPAFAEDGDFLIKLYRDLVRLRTFDTKAVNLQRTGKLGTYASTLGQEAYSVGYGFAMKPDDVLVPYYRDYGAQLFRGVTMAEILRYWGGDERGNNFAACREDFPICVPIASQLLHAVGVAKAIQYHRQQRAVVTTCGDGGTSEGDFYEAINLAGIWKLPVVFIVNNNQWAISVSRKIQTGSQTIAQKAIAGGISGEQVDGNDVIAVYEAAHRALEKARGGGGPSLIEAVTYRLCDHTTADDASRYRLKDDLALAWKEEPILRLRQFLIGKGWWDEGKEQALIEECSQSVDTAVTEYLQTPAPRVTDMFDYLYATLPADIAKQRDLANHFEEDHHG